MLWAFVRAAKPFPQRIQEQTIPGMSHDQLQATEVKLLWVKSVLVVIKTWPVTENSVQTMALSFEGLCDHRACLRASAKCRGLFVAVIA